MPDPTILSVTIAGVTINLSTPAPLKRSAPFESFLGATGTERYNVICSPVDALPVPGAPPLFCGVEYAVFPAGNRFLIRYHDHRQGDAPYAVTESDLSARQTRISCLPQGAQFLNELQNFFFHTRWEDMLLHSGRLILHASFISTVYGGVLFSGVSGVGKSTQAGLWVQHRGARLINGDRTILARRDGRWFAYGAPYAGSSNCFINEHYPLRAVVLLQQSENNTLHRLNTAQAFRGLYQGMTVAGWDPVSVEQACTLTADLAACVPVYRLCCTPDERPVRLLQAELEQGTN